MQFKREVQPVPPNLLLVCLGVVCLPFVFAFLVFGAVSFALGPQTYPDTLSEFQSYDVADAVQREQYVAAHANATTLEDAMCEGREIYYSPENRTCDPSYWFSRLAWISGSVTLGDASSSAVVGGMDLTSIEGHGSLNAYAYFSGGTRSAPLGDFVYSTTPVEFKAMDTITYAGDVRYEGDLVVKGDLIVKGRILQELSGSR